MLSFCIFSMEECKSTKLNFEYVIKSACQKKISWETLAVIFDDLTTTLVQSKQAIEVLLKELQNIVEIKGKEPPYSHENDQFLLDVLDKEIREPIQQAVVPQNVEKGPILNKPASENHNPRKHYPEVETIDLDDEEELPNPGNQNSCNKSINSAKEAISMPNL